MLFFKKKPAQVITVFNTKGRVKQAFNSLKKGEVKMYSCGPTVYDYVHIGNLRSFVFSDIVRRTFEYAGYKVVQVINITDFGHLISDADEGEDKMSKGLKREHLEFSMSGMKTLADKYTEAAREDFAMLNIKSPHAMPRASEHVQGMIAYIETLLHKNYAYKTSDGIYFDTSQFPEYGVLGGSVSLEHSRTGVLAEKRSPRDFALWKFNSEIGWDASWGKGFPGWHIECTAMSTRYLGKTFDVHTGGIDLSTTHHNNEIAQAECANGKPYAEYWFHHEFINLENQKISKSLGNTVNLRQLVDKGINPLAYRYWLLTGHYRSPMNFTWEAIAAAQTAWNRAQKIFVDLSGNGSVMIYHNNTQALEYRKKFEHALFDDFNTPNAIAILWEVLKDDSLEDGLKRALVLDFDKVLGLGFLGACSRVKQSKLTVTSGEVEEIKNLLKERESARAQKDFARADELRSQITAAGYTIEDGPEGPLLKKVTGEST